MTQSEVVELMGTATSVQDWYLRAQQVKKAFGGYPPYWNAATIPSQLQLVGHDHEQPVLSAEPPTAPVQIVVRQGSLAMIVFALAALAAAIAIPFFV